MHPQTVLLLCELPENVSVFNTNVSLQYNESFTGNINAHLMNSTTQTHQIYNQVESIFYCMNYESCLLTDACNTAAIFKTDSSLFKCFDSHSRNKIKSVKNLWRYHTDSTNLILCNIK